MVGAASTMDTHARGDRQVTTLPQTISIIKFAADDYGVYHGGYLFWKRGTWEAIEGWRDRSLAAGNILPSAPGEPPRQGQMAAAL